MHRGYIKVWRKIKDSGLYQMPNTFTLFMYLLTEATHKTTKVGTSLGVVELQPGEVIGGRLMLANELKQSEREIRTSLDRLTKLGILTITATSKYSVYSIVNYQEYQDSDQQTTSTEANRRPADDQQTTTKQTHKHINTEENLLGGKPPKTPCAQRRQKTEIVLPDWLPAQAWEEFVQHRRGSKHFSDLAQLKAIQVLEQLRGEGHDPVAVINRSIANGWKGLFPLKDVRQNGAQSKVNGADRHGNFAERDYGAGATPDDEIPWLAGASE